MIYIWKDEYPVFLELANLISSELDMPNEITNDLSKEGTWIIFFESFINHRHIFEKRKYIMVQTENILESVRLDSPNLRQEYQNFLRNAYAVWDYTKNFRLGYSKYYQIQYEQSKDMDVFFYGSINPRRKHILDQIPNLSTVSATSDIKVDFFPALWNYVRRSKIVLCINYYENSNTDVIRLAPLLTNRTFFIAEKTIDPSHNNRTEYVVSDYNNIPALCKYYLENPKERLKYIESGYNYIKNNPILLPDIYSERNINYV
jgi:hypothetical protein